MAGGTYLFYIDDSGAESTGYASYSWCQVAISDWEQGLSAWLAWRDELLAQYRIPRLVELHATVFANGRGNPSLDAGWNRRKSNRHRVMREAMTVLAKQEWLGVGTVYSHTTARRKAYAREQERVYQELVSLLDARLRATDDFGIIVMDGDGTDESYITAHRSLALEGRHGPASDRRSGLSELTPKPVGADRRHGRLLGIPSRGDAPR